MGSRPLLFLDFDGVLNSGRYFKTWRGTVTSHMLDPQAVSLLDEIVRGTRARVVFSTSWRHAYSPEALDEFLRERGYAGPPVVDQTPVLWRGDREEEIRSWLRRRGAPLERAVALDDLAMPDLGDRLVRTDPGVGLTRADARRAIELLGGTRS